MTTKYNEDLFRRVLTLIKHDRSIWDQNSFMDRSSKSSCGTTHCIAGWAVALTHGVYKPIENDPKISGIWILPERFEENTDSDIDVQDRIEIEAQALLGLSNPEVEEIFYFMDEDYYDPDYDEWSSRPVTYNEMVNRIMKVTGFDFSDLLDEEDANV